MADAPRPQGGDVFIVDNSDQDWKVGRYLRDWADLANAFDIATGYFEVGGLLALDGQWQKLGQIRILMGDEVSRRTHRSWSGVAHWCAFVLGNLTGNRQNLTV